MANNRMFLIHKPTKIGIMLGKRMGYGWYTASSKKSLDDFYEYLQVNQDGDQDDFILAMEDCENSGCFGDWQYSDKFIGGFRVFEYDIKEGDDE